jgi:hypothetical protein
VVRVALFRAVTLVLALASLPLRAAEPEEVPLRKLRAGFELGVTVADSSTGNPYNPYAQGAGLNMALTVGAQLTRHFGLYGVVRTPSYVFKDQMPGFGCSLDWFDFNALVATLTLNRVTLALGPSLDILWPVFANPGVGGGCDFRLDFELVHRTADQGARITIGLVAHPSAIQVSDPRGYLKYLKVMWVGGLTVGVQWQ